MANIRKASVLLLLLLAFAASGRAQDEGYSYVQLIVNGHAATTMFSDRQHPGWMQVLNVEATLNDASKNAAGKTRKHLWAIHTLNDGRTFVFLSKSGRRGPGKLAFLAGDDGGLGPLVQAQKQKIRIPTAELDLYSETDRFIGRFRITGLRVLSLEPVQNFACPEDSLTLRFESILREP